MKGGVILSLDESKKWIDKLRDDITRKIRERDIKEIIFYAGKQVWNEKEYDRYKRCKCYLKVLHYAADQCSKNHLKWFEIVDCIKKRLYFGYRVNQLTTELKV